MSWLQRYVNRIADMRVKLKKPLKDMIWKDLYDLTQATSLILELLEIILLDVANREKKRPPHL